MRIVFVQKFVPHYRLPFFERVRDRLAARGHEFVLLHGEADPFEGSKVRTVRPDWAVAARTRHVKIFGRWLYWLGVWRHLERGDVVVVEHAAKLLDNYLVFAARQAGWLRMGYFGHGRNFQASEELGVSAAVKRWMLRVDRWFAYTSLSREALLEQGVDPVRITVVENTLERPAERSDASAANAHEFVFVGGLYAQKLLPLLIDAATIIAAARPSFVLHIVGDGPEAPRVRAAAEVRPWLRVHGALYGAEREAVLARGSAILMPGLVGLVIIDAFQLSRPLIASDAGEHSPEIAYAEHGVNAIVVADPVTPERYAAAVLGFMDDAALRERLVAGCRLGAERYSIDAMADRFVDGVERMSDARPRRLAASPPSSSRSNP